MRRPGAGLQMRAGFGGLLPPRNRQPEPVLNPSCISRKVSVTMQNCSASQLGWQQRHGWAGSSVSAGLAMASQLGWQRRLGWSGGGGSAALPAFPTASRLCWDGAGSCAYCCDWCALVPAAAAVEVSIKMSRGQAVQSRTQVHRNRVLSIVFIFFCFFVFFQHLTVSCGLSGLYFGL